jgi:hypothetical protein
VLFQKQNILYQTQKKTNQAVAKNVHIYKKTCRVLMWKSSWAINFVLEYGYDRQAKGRE